jgi:hypothetical protein
MLFYTGTGSTLTVERMRITSAGKVGIGISAPTSLFHVDGGTGTATYHQFTNGTTTGQLVTNGTLIGIDATGNANINQQLSGAYINLQQGGTNYLRVDPAGIVIVGNNPKVDISGAGAYPAFQIIGITAVQMAGIQYSNDTIAPVFNLLKSRGALNAQGILSAADELGRIQFRGSDGVNFQAGASISALVDATPAAGSMPGRLVFFTTPTSTVTPVERMRFTSAGQMMLSCGIENTSTNTTVVSGTYSVAATDLVLLVDTTSARTITLPAPSQRSILWIKDKTGTAETNKITVAPNASESIEGVAASKTLSTNWGSWLFASDGTNWFML